MTIGLNLARSIARDLAQDLGNEVAGRTDLDRPLAHALDHTLTHARDQALHIGTRSLAPSLDRARALARGLDRVCSLARELARTTQAVVHFHHVLSDMTSVDLRSVDLAGIPLEGLRWSAKTRWPPEAEALISRDSVEITTGIFEVVRGGATYAPAKAQPHPS